MQDCYARHLKRKGLRIMKRILVIDDEQSMREAFGLILGGSNSVSTRASASEALEAASTRRWDLVIMDAIMPGLEFHSMKSGLDESSPGAPVLIVTSPRTLKTAADAVKYGAAGYITKPLDVTEIQVVVDRFLKSPERPPDAKMLSGGKSLTEAVDEFERVLINEALDENKGVQTRTARKLGISRRVLKYKMDKLKINYPGG